MDPSCRAPSIAGMGDVLMVALTVGFFALAAAFVIWLDRV